MSSRIQSQCSDAMICVESAFILYSGSNKDCFVTWFLSVAVSVKPASVYKKRITYQQLIFLLCKPCCLYFLFVACAVINFLKLENVDMSIGVHAK